jgi:hypothetical protein
MTSDNYISDRAISKGHKSLLSLNRILYIGPGGHKEDFQNFNDAKNINLLSVKKILTLFRLTIPKVKLLMLINPLIYPYKRIK